MAAHSEKEYQDLYFLSFLKKISKCICGNSIFLLKTNNKTDIFLLRSITLKEEGRFCACGTILNLLYFGLLMQP